MKETIEQTADRKVCITSRPIPKSKSVFVVAATLLSLHREQTGDAEHHLANALDGFTHEVLFSDRRLRPSRFMHPEVFVRDGDKLSIELLYEPMPSAS
jgi:hypothetical protein